MEEIDQTGWDYIAKQELEKHYLKELITDVYRKKVLKKLISAYLNNNSKNNNFNKLLKLDLWDEAGTSKQLIGEFKRLFKSELVFGIDISTEVCKRAKSNFKDLIVIQGDIRKLPFKEKNFDAVISIGTLEHLANDKLVLKGIYEILKPNGVFITTIPNLFNIWMRPLFTEMLRITGRYAFKKQKWYTPRKIRNLLLDSKFKDIKINGFILYPGILRYLDLYKPNTRKGWMGYLISNLLNLLQKYEGDKNSQFKKYIAEWIFVFARK